MSVSGHQTASRRCLGRSADGRQQGPSWSRGWPGPTCPALTCRTGHCSFVTDGDSSTSALHAISAQCSLIHAWSVAMGTAPNGCSASMGSHTPIASVGIPIRQGSCSPLAAGGLARVMPLPLGRYLCGCGHRSTAIVARWGQSCPALGCAGVGPARRGRPGNRSAEHEVRLEARSEDVWRRRRSLVEATGRA